ncbi:MAG TPA: biotin carboxylase N-terminal domain-containing protein [Actinomycetota bacterium]|nr:biotin carboxylase N-terminal domain-containing protein [Actinomycetota bacterium]
MFRKVLIANRGEIAVRIARTCRELGVGVVAVFSDADTKSRHVALADEAIHLPGVAPSETYLNVEAIIRAAVDTGAEAVHPGYGFLSEGADVAEQVADAGVTWIGPPAEAARAAGNKIQARRLAESVGVAPVPGTLDPVTDPREVVRFGDDHGYPVAIKAAGGGGGRGLKVARDAGEVEAALESARREARAYFGSEDVYLERYLERPKHVEIQILAPKPGQAMWLGARECSLQRRHQKLVEETPPPRFADRVPRIGEAAVAVADACGYANAGTVEFLVEEDGSFYFLEINARLQVEHTITEEVLGIDLVAEQLRIASGDPMGLSGPPEPRGHSMECRINAEDPSRGFLPGPGVIRRYREPGGPGIRVDSGFGEGDEVPRAYDSLIAKLVAWAPTREEVRRRMLRALREYVIEGIPTTIPAHRVLLELPEFVEGSYTTRTVEGGALDALMRETVQPSTDTDLASASTSAVLMVQGTPVRLWNPAISTFVSGALAGPSATGQGAVAAPMHGTVLKILVAEGDAVTAGDPIAVLETMKMETSVATTVSGTVEAVKVQPGDVMEAGEIVAVIG